MSIQDLIDLLSMVEDKSQKVMVYDNYESTSNVPVFNDVDSAYYNEHLKSFLIV